LKHLEKEDGNEDPEGGKSKKKHKDVGAQKYQKDYAMFMQDIEEDPELRGQIDLYKNEEVINELEKKLAGMNLEQQLASDKSKTQQELDAGLTKVGSEERRLAKGNRKTQEGKQKQAETEESRKKNEAIIKATLK
jgi:hypothetical protein